MKHHPIDPKITNNSTEKQPILEEKYPIESEIVETEIVLPPLPDLNNEERVNYEIEYPEKRNETDTHIPTDDINRQTGINGNANNRESSDHGSE
jgi:hypothetical protein